MRMKKLTGKRVPVWLNTNHNAALDLSAICYGPLAVTRTFLRSGQFGDTYAVTHVPTGYTVRDCLSRKTAKAVCEALLESNIPWKRVTLKNCEQYGKKIAAILKAVDPKLAA